MTRFASIEIFQMVLEHPLPCPYTGSSGLGQRQAKDFPTSNRNIAFQSGPNQRIEFGCGIRRAGFAKRNPRLADELGIGRPDLRRNFNDGGLLDVNHVRESYLPHLPGVNQDLAARIVGHRQSVGGFHTAGDLEVTFDVKPEPPDEERDFMIFQPLW